EIGSVIDPLLNETTYTYALTVSGFRDWSVNPADALYYLTDVRQYRGSAATGTLLKTVHTDYAPTNTILPFRETITWAAGNQVTQVETDYDSFAVWSGNITWKNPVAKREYAFGTGAPGALVRTTAFQYIHQSNTTYRNLNIASLMAVKSVYDSIGNLQAQTKNNYDNYGGSPFQSSNPAPNHDSTLT